MTVEEFARRPDLSIFLNARLSRIDLDNIPAPFPPGIAVEVVSPSESAVDLRHKVRDYLKVGSRVLVNTAGRLCSQVSVCGLGNLS